MGADQWSVAQVAGYLQVKESTVYSWAQQGLIPAHKEGRNWRLDPAEIEAWLAQHTQSAVEPEDAATDPA